MAYALLCDLRTLLFIRTLHVLSLAWEGPISCYALSNHAQHSLSYISLRFIECMKNVTRSVYRMKYFVIRQSIWNHVNVRRMFISYKLVTLTEALRYLEMSCRHRPLYSSVIADSLLSEILRAVDSRMTLAIEPLLVQYKVTELSLYLSVTQCSFWINSMPVKVIFLVFW